MTEVAAGPRDGIQAVVFDLGNVLIGWDPRRPYRRLLPDEAAIDEFFDTVDFHAWNHRQDAGGRWAPAVAELSARHPQYAELIAAYPQRFAETLTGPVPGTAAILDELRRAGIRVFALTNWSAELFWHARAGYDVLDRFEDVVVSGEVGLAKPDPAVFTLLLRRHALPAERTAFVDDSPANVAAAAAVGMRALRFLDAATLRDQLAALGLPVERQTAAR